MINYIPSKRVLSEVKANQGRKLRDFMIKNQWIIMRINEELHLFTQIQQNQIQITLNLDQEFQTTTASYGVFLEFVEQLRDGVSVTCVYIFCANMYIIYEINNNYQLAFVKEFQLTQLVKKEVIEGVKDGGAYISLYTSKGQHFCLNKQTLQVHPLHQMRTNSILKFLSHYGWLLDSAVTLIDSYIVAAQVDTFDIADIQKYRLRVLLYNEQSLQLMDQIELSLDEQQKDLVELSRFHLQMNQGVIGIQLYYFKILKNQSSYKEIQFIRSQFDLSIHEERIHCKLTHRPSPIFQTDDREILNQAHQLDSHMMEFGVLRVGSLYYYIKGTIATQINGEVLGLGVLAVDGHQYVTLAIDDQLVHIELLNRKNNKHRMVGVVDTTNREAYESIVQIWNSRGTMSLPELKMMFMKLDQKYPINETLGAINNFAYYLLSERSRGIQLELEIQSMTSQNIMNDLRNKQDQLLQFKTFLFKDLELQQDDVYQHSLSYILECVHRIKLALMIRENQKQYTQILHQCLNQLNYSENSPTECIYTRLSEIEIFMGALLGHSSAMSFFMEFLSYGRNLVEQNGLHVEWWVTKSILPLALSMPQPSQVYLVCLMKECGDRPQVLKEIFFKQDLKELYCEQLNINQLFDLYLEEMVGASAIDKVIVYDEGLRQQFVDRCIEREQERLNGKLVTFRFLSMIKDFKNRQSIKCLLGQLCRIPKLQLISSLVAGCLDMANEAGRSISFDSRENSDQQRQMYQLVDLCQKAQYQQQQG